MKTALTIGFFDGVHLGHQMLLNKLRSHPHTTILTFDNHPFSLICPPAPPLLLSYEQRIELLREYADVLVVLPFTEEFASTRYDALLNRFDISHLILGEGSVFGKNREGTEENVRLYCAKKGIEVEYLPKLLFEKEPISSSRIRKAIASQQTALAEQLLGRPW